MFVRATLDVICGRDRDRLSSKSVAAVTAYANIHLCRDIGLDPLVNTRLPIPASSTLPTHGS